MCQCPELNIKTHAPSPTLPPPPQPTPRPESKCSFFIVDNSKTTSASINMTNEAVPDCWLWFSGTWWCQQYKFGNRIGCMTPQAPFNTLRPIQNGRLFPDDIFKWVFLNGNICISIKISLKFVPKGPIDNIPALVQIMAWRRPGDKLLSEPMMVILPTHICVTRPQWFKNASCRKWWKAKSRNF